jgi:hypothetical protein
MTAGTPLSSTQSTAGKVYQRRTQFPDQPPASERTRAAQAVQESVWDRIAKEARAQGGTVAPGVAGLGLLAAPDDTEAAEMAPAVEDPDAPQLLPWDMTWRERTQAGVQDGLERLGMGRGSANRAAYGIAGGGEQNMGMGLLDATPVGVAFGLQEGKRAIDRGRAIGGVEGAVEGGLGLLEVGLNAIPAVAATRGLVKKGGRALKRRLGRASQAEEM